MWEEEKIYSVELEGKEYGFFLNQKSTNVWHLEIPDCGGMADMIPRFPIQYNWISLRIQNIKGVKEIWGTIWEIQGIKTLETVEKVILSEGKISNKQAIDFY